MNAPTLESNFAPRWLVFKDKIINCSKVEEFVYDEDSGQIITIYNGSKTRVKATKENWNAIQKAFAFGVEAAETKSDKP